MASGYHVQGKIFYRASPAKAEYPKEPCPAKSLHHLHLTSSAGTTGKSKNPIKTTTTEDFTTRGWVHISAAALAAASTEETSGNTTDVHGPTASTGCTKESKFGRDSA